MNCKKEVSFDIANYYNKLRNSKATIDDFLKPQKYIKHNEQEVSVNYDFTNGKSANFTGFVPLQDVLLKMNWNDYHLKDVNFNNVFLETSLFYVALNENINIKQRFDIQLTIRNDTRKEPTRFVGLSIAQTQGQKYDYYRFEKWDYNNEEEYKKAIKVALSKIYGILFNERF